MPRRPDKPCSSCGRLLWRGTGSRTNPICRPCRRANPPAPKPPKLINRDCTRCGQPIRSQYRLCRDCRRGTTGERGYGPAHQRARKRALAEWIPGQPCVRCGEEIWTNDAIDLDHNDDRTGYLGLAHRACNRRHNHRRREAACDQCGVPIHGSRKYCSTACYKASRRQETGA